MRLPDCVQNHSGNSDTRRLNLIDEIDCSIVRNSIKVFASIVKLGKHGIGQVVCIQDSRKVAKLCKLNLLDFFKKLVSLLLIKLFRVYFMFEPNEIHLPVKPYFSFIAFVTDTGQKHAP